MYNVAICDDDKIFLEKLKNIIIDFCSENFICQEIFSFSSGLKLIASKELFSILILDIQMEKINGFQIAEILSDKLKKENTLLIFCTDYDATVYQAFDYQPFHFIRKSNVEKQLPQVLLKAFEKINRDSQVYTFNGKESEIIIDGKEIIYFEIYGKKIKIVTTDKPYYIYGTLNQIEEKVNEINFMRIHKSYIVNCDFIKNINSKGVNIYGKEDEQITLPISRGKTKIIKQKFHNFAILSGGKK